VLQHRPLEGSRPLFPEALDEYITEENPIRVIDVFVDHLDLSSLGFKTDPAQTVYRAIRSGLVEFITVLGATLFVMNVLLREVRFLNSMNHRYQRAEETINKRNNTKPLKSIQFRY